MNNKELKPVDAAVLSRMFAVLATALPTYGRDFTLVVEALSPDDPGHVSVKINPITPMGKLIAPLLLTNLKKGLNND